MLGFRTGQGEMGSGPLPFVKLKEALNKWQCELQGSGWNSLFGIIMICRGSYRGGGNDKEYRVESAKMLATVLHGMQGTPYIYQGEELGMTNTDYEIGEYRDIETLHMYEERLEAGYSEEEIMRSIHAKGRDNARTPMQWSGGEGPDSRQERHGSALTIITGRSMRKRKRQTPGRSSIIIRG